MSPGAAYEACGGMTGMAIQSGRDVGGVGLSIHANRGTTIMTRSTIVHDTGMIKHRSDEGTGVMTDTAILVCWYMVTCFTGGERTIVTGSTVIHDANMIKGCRNKARGLVAHVAILGCWHMVWRRSFSSGGCTIVA